MLTNVTGYFLYRASWQIFTIKEIIQVGNLNECQ